ncbi:MAG: Gfo/Idh/MocA family oxidoreductase [Candidatus Latescibacterota bacterium]
MVRWGVLGAGSVAQRRVMPAMTACPDCRLEALMVRDAERARQLASRFGARRSHGRVEDLVADPQVDAVYVSTPVGLHCEHVLAAAAHGKHVLCEKPMALSADQCRRMIAACEAAGAHLEVCFVLRGWPVYQRIRALLQSGRLGRLVEARAQLAKWTPRQPGEWRLDATASGGGALMDVGSHYLDLLRFLLGEFRRIACLHTSAVFGWPVEETALALIEFCSGAHGTLSVSCAVPHGGNVLEVYGTQASLLLGRQLTILAPGGEETETAEYPDYYSGLLAHFCRRVTQGGEALASGLDGLRNVEVITAAYHAAREGRVVELGGCPADS